MSNYLNKARKIGFIMLGAGLLFLSVMAGQVASTGETSELAIWLPSVQLRVGLGGVYDPRSLIALSSSVLFPAEIRMNMSPAAKRTGYLFVALGAALALLIRYSFFQ
jgi:hypothetical protein